MRATLSAALLLVGTFLVAPAAVRADTSVVVLGIAAEGDDELGRNVSSAVRVAASRVAGWAVSPNEVTLAQISLAMGCEETPDPTCLSQIAETVGAEQLVYGTLRRAGDAMELTLSLFDASSHTVLRTTQETLSARRTDIDDIREPTRRVLARLTGPETGTLRVEANVPAAAVVVDGAEIGTTDAEGHFTTADLAIGAHEVEVRSNGHTPWRGTVTLGRGTEMTLDARLEDAPIDTPAPSGGGPTLAVNWTAIALIGVGAASFGVAGYAMSHIQDLNGAAAYQSNIAVYRDYYAANAIPGGATDVCKTAESDAVIPGFDAGAVRATCGDGATYEVLQYVFLGLAAASGVTGAVMLAVDPTGTGGATQETPAVSVLPSFGTDRAGLSARVRF